MLISFLSVLAVSIYKIIPSLNKISNSFQAIQFFTAPFYDIIRFLDIDTDKVSPINNLKFNSIDYNNDRFLGRLDREQFHETLRRFPIAISIPLSDSSPRSVYEAIFSGCIVIIRDCLYIHSLPICMRSRLVITDCNGSWLDSCYQEALLKSKEPYLPSDEAMCSFDQSLSVQRVMDKLNMESEFTKIFSKL